MMRVRSLLPLALLATGLMTGYAVAQSSNGTILGTVVDQSGAVIPNAKVEITNTATGIITNAVTQGDGDYTAPNLIPGPYTVSVALTGFQTTEATGVLVANQMLRMNITMHAGKVTQTVRVSATGQLLNTDSPTISTFVSQRQINDVPTATRNFSQLLVLSPNTLATGQTFGGPGNLDAGNQTAYRSGLSGGMTFVGGNQGSSNKFMIDGVDDNDPSFQTPTITPSLDAISGIRLMSQNYPAQYGGSAAQINISTKSGTNQYHGTLYDFFQNDSLNATDFFSLRDPITHRIKPVERYNQFGGSLGGPLTIPKIINGHNRMFFFFNYEGLRSHTVSSGFGLYPTAAELSGNFSADPPIVNPATGKPFPGNIIPPSDFSSKAKQIIALGMFPTPNVAPQPAFNTVKSLTNPDNIDQYLARVDAKISSRDSLFVRWAGSAETRLAPSVDKFGGEEFGQKGKNLAVGYTHIFSPTLVNVFHAGMNRPVTVQEQFGAFGENIAGSIFPQVSSVPATFGAPLLLFSNFAVGAPPNAPLDYTTTDESISDDLTYIRGAHTLMFGARVRHLFFKEINADAPRGTIGFTGAYTGNSIADFLLGDANTASLNEGNFTGWYNSHGWDFFAQDDWKVTPRVTVNLGLRYEYESPLVEEHDRVSFVDLTYPGGRYVTPNVAAAKAIDSPLVGTINSRNITKPDYNNFAPRVGFAFRPTQRTVIRGGFGIFYNNLEYNDYFFPILNPPFANSASFAGTPTVSVPLDSLFPISPTPAPLPGATFPLMLDRNMRTAYVDNWNLDVERQLSSTQSIEIGYTGSESTHLQYERQGAQGILTGNPSNPVVFPYSNFFVIFEIAGGVSSNYNAGFIHYSKRFGNGFSLLGNYTYSKAMGTSSGVGELGSFLTFAQNAWDQNADYGALAFDATNNVVLSGIWDLPFGKGMAFANRLPSAANYIIGGWQLNGIYNYRSGFPFQISALFDNSFTISGNPRAQVTGNPHRNSSTPHGIAFNTAAFSEPAPLTFGNSSTDPLRGKALANTDLSLFKNTHIGERFNAQLRLEAFNVFNQSDPGPVPGFVQGTGPFGQYTSLQHQARIVQIAVKLIF